MAEATMMNRKNSGFAPVRMNNPTIQPQRAQGSLCIRRDSAALVMATPLAIQLSHGNLLPYPGSVKDSKEKLQAYVDRFLGGGFADFSGDRGTIDIGQMNRTDLINFAEDEYGLTDLRDNKKLSLNDIRQRVMQAHTASQSANGLPPEQQTSMGIGLA